MIKRKQRFSLRKNKIGAMSVLLGISFVGAVASGSDVKANEISEEKAPKLIEKEVVGKTTKQDVEKAQAKVDASKEAESLKNKAIENKITEINNNDNEISKIKADIERDKDATDENINKAEKKVELATEELKNKNSELVKTKAEKEERESDLVLVKKDVADKSKDLETKQAKAKEIKDEIDSTENVTKKLETEKAKNEVVKKELETEKFNKVAAEKELEKAKEFDEKLADNTKKAEGNLKAKTTDLDNAKKDEATKKAEYDAVVMPYGRNVKYKIALDQRFVDKFKEYMDYTLNWEDKGITMKEMFAKRAELREELKAIEKEINHEFLYNRYSHEDDYEIDLKNMSEEERLKMSQYGVYLLNQIRSQFGLEPLKVNKNSMQLAKEITETVMRDNHSNLNAGHYVKGISEVAAKHGLIRGKNYYENLYNAGSTIFSDHKMSRNALYEHVYNSVMLFFYEGLKTGGYGHAERLYEAKTPMGLAVAHFENVGEDYNVNRLPKELIEKYKQYIKFDEFGNILKFEYMPLDIYDKFEEAKANAQKQGIIKISYVKVEENVAIPGSLDKDDYPIYDDESKEAMERAKQNFIAKYSNESKDTVELPAVPDLESFKKAYADAVKVRESKEQPVVDAKANVDSATKALDELKATEKQTEKATAKVQEIDAKINNLNTKADEQQKVVDQLELDNVKYIEKMTKLAADLDAAQKDVAESTKLLDQAKVLQKDVEGKIATATSKISQLENEIEISKKALDEAKNNFDKIRKARLELDKNKEKLVKVTAVKVELEKELSTLKPELVAITKQLADDTKELEKVQRQFKLDNFKWAVLADNNTIDPIEFDLEKYLKDEEEKKKKSEIRPEQPITPETPDKPELPGQPIIPGAPVKPERPEQPTIPKPELPEQPTTPGAPDKPETPNVPAKPEDKAPGSSNNQPDIQRPSVNTNGLNTLPNTGESQTGIATVAGLVALAIAARLRKNKENN